MEKKHFLLCLLRKLISLCSSKTKEYIKFSTIDNWICFENEARKRMTAFCLSLIISKTSSIPIENWTYCMYIWTTQFYFLLATKPVVVKYLKTPPHSYNTKFKSTLIQNSELLIIQFIFTVVRDKIRIAFGKAGFVREWHPPWMNYNGIGFPVSFLRTHADVGWIYFLFVKKYYRIRRVLAMQSSLLRIPTNKGNAINYLFILECIKKLDIT